MSVQMDRSGPGRDRIETESREETDSLVLEHLQRIARNGIAAASKRDLAAALPMSPATASRALARLMDAGRIELVTRGTGGRYRSRYRVHAAIPAQPAA